MMYEDLIENLRFNARQVQQFGSTVWKIGTEVLLFDAADAIEELSKRINRAVELYNRGVEKSAMYEHLVGIAPEPPKEKE